MCLNSLLSPSDLLHIAKAAPGGPCAQTHLGATAQYLMSNEKKQEQSATVVMGGPGNIVAVPAPRTCLKVGGEGAGHPKCIIAAEHVEQEHTHMYS